MLIIGCGDIGLRIAQHASPERELYGVVRSDESASKLQAAAIHSLQVDMDENLVFPAVPAQAQWVYLVPPDRNNLHDNRLRAWLAATPAEQRPARLVYISTSGVYGDHQGGWVDEHTPVQPETDRAKRRVDAEQLLHNWCSKHCIDLLILRVPGIIGIGRDSLNRLQSGEPLIHPDQAPYTNVVDADYLAKAILFLASKAEAGIYNISDRQPITVTERYLSLCAQYAIPVPRFISLEQAKLIYSPMRMSYLNESRRLNTDKLWSVFKI